ncbi:MAG: hypothetical protein R2867_00035 [Caldilineaceae bacterium]
MIASGGLADLYDLGRLKAHEHYNIAGAIVGQSIYTGTLDLAQAIELGHRPLRQSSAGIIPVRYHEGQPEFLLLFNLFFEQWQFPAAVLTAKSVIRPVRSVNLKKRLSLCQALARCLSDGLGVYFDDP